MKKPLHIKSAFGRTDIKDFRVNGQVCFVRTVDRHDQVEHPDPLPVINAGSLGTVLENDGKSVLIGLAHPQDSSRQIAVRFYPADIEEDDCSIKAIEPLQDASSFARQSAVPQTVGYVGPPDEYLDSASAQRPRRRTIDDIFANLRSRNTRG